ncbi:SLC13 family permease [candidate division KSB1 bacterium]|nr:anion permease [candidate division KSB1 bacterium]RQW05736.1 MAG: SLC13 family permease [candidate division KSB1 bacterium]
MFDFAFYYTAFLILAMSILLIRDIFEPDIIIFSVLILLILGGVISVEEAFSGFSNHGMLTVMFLFIIAAAIQQTGMLNLIGDKIFGGDGKLSIKLLRFLLPVSAISAFFNNTPIVAMFIPAIRIAARKGHFSVSKFMIPLSYASILGGLCTLIGTSTTLVIHGLLIDSGMPGFGFFEISKIGVPLAFAGVLLISFVGHRLLPDRKSPSVQLGENTREFVIEMKVEKDYKHIGKTIAKAGLRHLKGLYLFQIERQGAILSTVGPNERIKLGDRLFFTGLPETILELQRTPGLSLLKDVAFNLKSYDSDEYGVFEVVVSAHSPLIGKNVRFSQFRTRYQAVILAIHRSGERIQKKIGDIILHGGDTLLILAKKNFAAKWYHSKDFYLVSRSPALPSKPKWYSWFSLGVLATMIVAMATGALPILVAVCLASIILILSKTISPEEARKSVNWSVLLVIASAFGVAKGMANSGFADFLAHQLVHLFGVFGPVGLLAGVYLITSIYTLVITNNAAAALVFPVTLSITQTAVFGDPRPFFLVLAIGASASFASPIGYQTNLMVYGPGGYKFKDFLKIGLPMNIFVGIVALALITFYYF